jgi:RNA polymerase sigma-70 factor (ECF subfamily)
MDGGFAGRSLSLSLIDEEGFESLFRRHYDFVWRNLRRLGVPNAACDDALQDVFVTAHRKRGQLDPTASERGWLYAILRRIAFRYRRSEWRRKRKHDAFGELIDGSAREAPGRLLDARRFMGEFLDGLGEKRRPVFIMVELEGMSAPEVADALELKLNTVYSRLRLGRAAFVRAVERFGDEDSAQLSRARRGQDPPAGAAAAAWVLFEPRILDASWIGSASGWSLREQLLVFVTTVAVGGGAVAGLASVLETRAPPVAAIVQPDAQPDTDTSVASSEEVSTPLPRAASEVSPASPLPVAKTRAIARPKPKLSPAVAPATVVAGIDREARLLKRAKSQLASGNAADALSRLAEHEREFPGSRLADVRDAIRIDALCKSDKGIQARAEARLFSGRHPGSQLATAVRDACDG